MGKNRGRRNSGREITKISELIVQDEKRNSTRRLRLRATCRHPSDGDDSALIPKEMPDHTMRWVCRYCHEQIDLRAISDEKLRNAIQTITDACNFIKIMARSERDDRLVDEVVSDVQYKLNAFIVDAYHSARNTSNKRRGIGGGSSYRTGGTTVYEHKPETTGSSSGGKGRW